MYVLSLMFLFSYGQELFIEKKKWIVLQKYLALRNLISMYIIMHNTYDVVKIYI